LLFGVLVLASALPTTADVTSRWSDNQTAAARARLQEELAWVSSLPSSRLETHEADRALRRMLSGYRGLIPFAPGLAAADRRLNYELARRSLSWLHQSSLWYLRDAVLARSYFDAYDTLGRYYSVDSHFYVAGAYVAYASAARFARRLMLGPGYGWVDAELGRFAAAYGGLVLHDHGYIGYWASPRDLSDNPDAHSDLQPMATPAVDSSVLSEPQRSTWEELRPRFRLTAQRVHRTRVSLQELANTLTARGLELHPENASIAMNMQGFLEDAAELIEQRDFETATQALRRAEYEQARLNRVTGQ
jgi:hypothetical protein